ncbi:MAG: MBL fold metallo-hydrolase [Bacteroidota bacterium]|nr:MBL fold metallo-hydrolase [Bacteroidota bacterium]
MDKLRFLSLGSGSSGNCYYFGNSVQGILIDAGIAARTVRKSLKEIGVDFSQILGVFVSHDHIDHIKAVGALGERFNLPVYATAKTHNGINRCWGAAQKLNGNRRVLEPGEKVQVGDFSISPYSVSHDATESVCFELCYRSHHILIATDLGCTNEEVCSLIRQSDIVVLEANYDERMLKEGKYPYYLKQRITSDTGHLCNTETGRVLAENWHPDLKYIYLCHLSKDNNNPELALQTVETCLNEAGITYGSDVTIEPLNRNLNELVEFDD